MSYSGRRSQLRSLEELDRTAEFIKGLAGDIPIAAIGGYAMQFYGSRRLTGDVDIVAARHLWAPFLPEVKQLRFGGKMYMGPPPDSVPFDWIVREDQFAKLYQEALRTAAELVGAPIPVVLPEYLAAMKLASANVPIRTRQDIDDLLCLLRQPGLVDRALARQVIVQYVGGEFAGQQFDVYAAEADRTSLE